MWELYLKEQLKVIIVKILRCFDMNGVQKTSNQSSFGFLIGGCSLSREKKSFVCNLGKKKVHTNMYVRIGSVYQRYSETRQSLTQLFIVCESRLFVWRGNVAYTHTHKTRTHLHLGWYGNENAAWILVFVGFCFFIFSFLFLLFSGALNVTFWLHNRLCPVKKIAPRIW